MLTGVTLPDLLLETINSYSATNTFTVFYRFNSKIYWYEAVIRLAEADRPQASQRAVAQQLFMD